MAAIPESSFSQQQEAFVYRLQFFHALILGCVSTPNWSRSPCGEQDVLLGGRCGQISMVLFIVLLKMSVICPTQTLWERFRLSCVYIKQHKPKRKTYKRGVRCHDTRAIFWLVRLFTMQLGMFIHINR